MYELMRDSDTLMCYLGDDIEHWVSCSLSQTVLLSLEMRWTSELYTALTSENPVQQLRHIRLEHNTSLKQLAGIFFFFFFFCCPSLGLNL